jgi:hypothetical protein
VQSVAELNALLAAADERELARHIAGRIQTVGEVATAERPALRPLPAERFEAGVLLHPKADRRSRVCVRQAFYSVPVRFANRHLNALMSGSTVRLLDGGRPVATHERNPRRGGETLLLDHYLEILMRKPGAFPGSVPLAQARASGAFTAAHESFWRRARRRLGDAAGTRALIEVLLLHRAMPFPAVHAALDAVNRIGSVDPALVAIEARRIIDRKTPASVSVRPKTPGTDRPKPSLAHYDGLLAGASR